MHLEGSAEQRALQPSVLSTSLLHCASFWSVLTGMPVLPVGPNRYAGYSVLTQSLFLFRSTMIRWFDHIKVNTVMGDENKFQSLAAAFGLSTRNDITRSCLTWCLTRWYLHSNHHPHHHLHPNPHKNLDNCDNCVIIYPVLSDINDDASFWKTTKWKHFPTGLCCLCRPFKSGWSSWQSHMNKSKAHRP